MKVQHSFELIATCPVDGGKDFYRCTVTLDRLLVCEEMLDLVEQAKEGGHVYQEDLTQKLADALGAEVRTEGTHVGGKVSTVVVCVPGGDA